MDIINEIILNIFELYDYVKVNKGFKESNNLYIKIVIANGLFGKFIKEKKIFKNSEEARKVYDQYLFHFILYEEEVNTNPKRPIEEILAEIFKYDPSYIIEIPIIYSPEDKSFNSKRILESFKYDLVILRGFLPKFGLDNRYLNKEYLLKHHPRKKLDVIEQDPSFYGFTTNKYNK